MRATGYVVDDCPDALGFWTVRYADGSLHGDIHAAVIATVYDEDMADQIADALNERLDAEDESLEPDEADELRAESDASVQELERLAPLTVSIPVAIRELVNEVQRLRAAP